MAESDTVRLIRESYDAFNRGDFEAAMEHAHPEFELHRPPSGPYAGAAIRGREGVLSYRTGRVRRTASHAAGVHRGRRVVLVLLKAYGRGAGSGIELEEEAFLVWRIRDEKAYSLEIHPNRDDAYASAGLNPG